MTTPFSVAIVTVSETTRRLSMSPGLALAGMKQGDSYCRPTHERDLKAWTTLIFLMQNLSIGFGDEFYEHD